MVGLQPMKIKTFHKILATIFIFTLLLPIGVSFVHAFEEHHFEDCGTILQFHTHKNEINCSTYHYIPSFLTTENNNVYTILIPKVFQIEVISLLSTLITSTTYSSKRLRAPPVFC